MLGFYVLHLFCVWPPAYPVAICQLSSLFLLFHIVVQFVVVVVVVVVVVMFRQFDFSGCDYTAFENIHGGSHVVVRSGFS